jgi:serine/threonine protein kinase/predicted Zn-dependent protease
MALRKEAGEDVAAADYLGRFPGLGDETFVALIYEEFCLREDAGEAPEAAEFLTRYADVADRLRRVFDIHGLLGSAATATFNVATANGAALPDVGQTIGGFRLVEELGRGSFARVFRAEERQLADRPVALKVARGGSREPQTLARLQHTHIVPVHSYRIDPATGLHLLCMPYVGGVTLARLLADPQVASARTGLEVLEAIDRLEPSQAFVANRASAARAALAQRSYARSIAWWGARLAEALQHAHERGVLHRDVKPSNVLVTGDGLAMLLDFNLAWEARIDSQDLEPSAALGGTLAYMAPEHLDALAAGKPGKLDARADLFALGVVLYEAMGSRPFDPPARARTVSEILRESAQSRRDGPPRLRDRHPEVPPEYEAVVHRCLEPDPRDRYSTAAELAADLQAIADDAPLSFAREPVLNRVVRWTRRNRARLAVAVPLLLAAVVIGGVGYLTRQARERLTDDVRGLVYKAMILAGEDRLDEAEAQFDLAARIARRDERADDRRSLNRAREKVRTSGDLEDLRAVAREEARLAREKKSVRAAANDLHERAESLRLRLLGFLGAPGDPSAELREALAPFYVLSRTDWTSRAELHLLEPFREARLRADVEDLLFLWVIALDDLMDRAEPEDLPKLARAADSLCQRGLAIASEPGPWDALRERLAARSQGREAAAWGAPDIPIAENSGRICFLWGVLRAREQHRRAAIAWLERATRLDPGQYWYHYLLAYQYQLRLTPEGDEQALTHYNVAVALRPERPWAWFDRAQLHRSRGAWNRALEDLTTALEWAGPSDTPRIRLTLGVTQQALGDGVAARESYREVLANANGDVPLTRAARLNLARLDADAGAWRAALATYNDLLKSDPDDLAARQGRALIRIRTGDVDGADSDLSELLKNDPPRAAWLALRAEVRLAMGRGKEAERDAARALELRPGPAHQRLWNRVLLAVGRDLDPRLDGPEDLARLPYDGPPLERDLQQAAARLAAMGDSGDLRALLNRAVILAALGDHDAAEAQAGRAVTRWPGSARPLLVRARLRRTAGRLREALADVERGLRIEPDDARFLEIRGLVRTELGDPEAGLDDLDRAAAYGSGRTLYAARARALSAVGRHPAAIEAWTAAALLDPEDPRMFLGRAHEFIHLKQWDQALADLEKAIDWSGDDPLILIPIVRSYARCLPARPNRWPRVLTLVRRAAAAGGGYAAGYLDRRIVGGELWSGPP